MTIEERLCAIAAESRAEDLTRTVRELLDSPFDRTVRARAETLLRLIAAGEVRVPSEATPGRFWG